MDAFVINLRAISARELSKGQVELGHIVGAAADAIARLTRENEQLRLELHKAIMVYRTLIDRLAGPEQQAKS